MSVDLALFRGDELLGRGSICIRNQRESSEFALQDDMILFISHEFALPASSLSVELRRRAEGAKEKELLLEAGLAMGVHESDDWESVSLGPEYTLGFFCRPVT